MRGSFATLVWSDITVNQQLATTRAWESLLEESQLVHCSRSES